MVNSINSTSTLCKVQQELRSPLRVWRLLCSLSFPLSLALQLMWSRWLGAVSPGVCMFPRGGWGEWCVCLVQGCAGHPFSVLLSAQIKVDPSAFRTADKSRGAMEEKGSTRSTCDSFPHLFSPSSFTEMLRVFFGI